VAFNLVRKEHYPLGKEGSEKNRTVGEKGKTRRDITREEGIGYPFLMEGSSAKGKKIGRKSPRTTPTKSSLEGKNRKTGGGSIEREPDAQR